MGIFSSLMDGLSVISGVTLDMMFGKKEFDYLFAQIKLQNLDSHKPILRKTVTGASYKAYLFTIPIGLSIEDFENNQMAIAQYLHKKPEDVIIELVNNQALITVKESIKGSFDYEDYDFKDGNKIPIGINLLNNSIIYWEFNHPSNCHLLLGGASGSGKSVTLNVILTHVIKYLNAELYIQDTKEVDLVDFGKSNKTKVYNGGLDYFEETIQDVVDEMKDRYKWLAEKGYRNMNSCPSKIRKPYIFYIVEELASFNPKTNADFYKNLSEILAKGRASGIYCIITAQSPYSDILPGMIKSNFNTKIGLKTNTGESSKVISGNFDLLTSLRGKGHGYIINGNGTVEFQGFNIKDKTIRDAINGKVVNEI